MYIFNKLGIEVYEGSETITEYASGVLMLSLIALFGFLNVLDYFLSLYLVQRYDIKIKYSKLRRIISFYKIVH
jgi:hypothetical protein